MRTIWRFFWVVPVLALGSGLFHALAQDFLAPTKGTVLIMKTERTFEGEIQRKGREYILRLDKDSEITFKADNVLRLCQDWDEAVTFMKKRAALDDPDERLRLAEWCYRNHLLEYARNEAKAALDMRPQDSKAKQLLEIFEREIANPPKQADAEPPAKSSTPQIDISQESLTLFTTKVQPILLNNCARCHSGGRGGDFQLHRANDGGQRSATQRNLAAVLGQLDVDRPQLSPLLLKAVNLHGNQTQAAIRGKKTTTFETLQTWVDHYLENNPQARDHEPALPRNSGRDKGFGGTTPMKSSPELPANTGTLLYKANRNLPGDSSTGADNIGGGAIVSNGYPAPNNGNKAAPGNSEHALAGSFPGAEKLPATKVSGAPRPKDFGPSAKAPVRQWNANRITLPNAGLESLAMFTPALPEGAVGLPAPDPFAGTVSRPVIAERIPGLPELPAKLSVAAPRPRQIPANQQTQSNPPPPLHTAPPAQIAAPLAPPPASLPMAQPALGPDEYDVSEWNRQVISSRSK